MKLFVKLALILLISLSVISVFGVIFCAKQMQKYCVNLLPNTTENKSELQTIICGENSLAPEQNRALKNLGLLHLFVISAGQLIWWRQFLLLFLKSERSHYLFFTALTLGTGFQAPLVRALFDLFLQKWIPLLKTLSRDQQILISGAFCYWILPSSQIFSLQLSWLCALLVHQNESRLKSLVFLQLVFFAVSLFLFQGQEITPWSVLMNLVFAPLFSFLIYPISLVAFISKAWLPWDLINASYESLWSWVWSFLQSYVASEPTSVTFNFLLAQKKAWVLLFSTHAYFHFRNIKFLQRFVSSVFHV